MKAHPDQQPLNTGNGVKPRSGARRGGAVRDPAGTPGIVRASHIELLPDADVAQGFHAIVSSCETQIRGNEAGVAYGLDPESVHQMRVGLRRMRSALRLFKEVVPLPAGMKKEIAWLAGKLGDVRDWEVLAGTTLPAVEQGATEDLGLPALRAAAAAVAQRQRRKAATAVRSVRYARMMESINGWIRKVERRLPELPSGGASHENTIKAFADRHLARDMKRLLKSGSQLRTAGPEARHAVRIAAKRVRYATEFFQSLYPPRRVKRYTARLSALQDGLGRLNDFAVADALLRELQEKRNGLAASASYARGYLASSAAREYRKLYKVWRRFKEAKPPSAG